MQLLFVGIDVESEGKDRVSLDLPGHQSDLLQDAYTFGKSIHSADLYQLACVCCVFMCLVFLMYFGCCEFYHQYQCI